MGTRSLTNVKAADGTTLVTIYRQFDGYPNGIGADIKAAIGGKMIVNGFNDAATQINGIESAAAMLVASLANPKKTGNVYIFKPDTVDVGEEYAYTISEKDGRLWLVCRTCYGAGKLLYEGLLDDFDPEAAEKIGAE